MEQHTPANAISATSSDLDVGKDTLQILAFYIGNGILLLLTVIVAIGAGALSGRLCRYMRRTKSGEDKFGEGLPSAMPFANVIVFLVVGMLLGFTHDEQVHSERPAISFIGSLGMLLLVELIFTLVVGGAVMGYTAFERAVQKHTEESVQLQDRRGSHDDEDEESATGAKQGY